MEEDPSATSLNAQGEVKTYNPPDVLIHDVDEEKPEGEEGEKPEGGEEGEAKGEGEEKHPAELEEEMTEDAEALKVELAKIQVAMPKTEPVPMDAFDPAEFTASYKDNLPKEKLVLQYADNFKRQYIHLYRDRMPLFLNPVNECGLEKFVCTTIRPTQLPFNELYNWESCAEFVSDYLNFIALEPPFELPVRLISPATVLKIQKGNCFEYSTLLCSLLIAAGYDAYVVNGYATREVCLADETREICPLLKKKEELKQEEKKKELKKYTVKPAKDLRSRYEIKMENRRIAEKEAEEEKRRKEEEERQLELEKPPADPLHGLRIHSWVLVLCGKREVPESFFIEPFTGLSQPLDCPNYLGIESVWNNTNYWVNMQDCSEGVKTMKYDLGDPTLWEYMFPGLDKPILQIPEAEEDNFDFDDEDEEEEVEKHLDMPPSWVEPLRLTLKDFQMRCPQGKKTKLYKKAKLEKFAHYLMPDGLVSRLSVYDNKELTDLVMVREYYAHREDKLHTRAHNHMTGWITEHFHAGRSHCLKEHQYKGSAPGPENDRIMVFFNEARVDGLVNRMETPTEMTEHFQNRDDFLYYLHVEFGRKTKRFGPRDSSPSHNLRSIQKMVQRFHRDKSKPANEDMMEIVYLMSEDKIQVTYHTEDRRIAASTRDFLKPANWDEKGAVLTWQPDMHSTFQVDPNAKAKKQVVLYQTLLDLLKKEDKCREHIRDSEMEVQEVLQERIKEETSTNLEISVYDTDRNEKAKKHRKELERQIMEDKMRKQEMEIDYLAPFLAQIGDPEKLTRQQAYRLKEECLGDLKMRLIDKANLIQSRFEKETAELQKKQAWYQQNQVSMSKDDEEEYLNYCSEAMFRIHILELRLNRHKEMAPHKFMALEQKLRNDPRLSEFVG